MREQERVPRMKGRPGQFWVLAVIMITGFAVSAACGFQLIIPLTTNTQVELAWDPSSDPSVSGNRLYGGTASRDYSFVYDTANATSITVSALHPGAVYFFAATAYATNGLESDFSQEITFTNATVAGVPSPKITALTKTTDGNFSISSSATAGMSYVLLAATNLVPPITWSPLLTNTADAQGGLSMLDEEATNYPQRFYQIGSQPY